MTISPKSPWSLVDRSIGELTKTIVELNQNEFTKLHLKYCNGNFDEPALDIFVRRDEIADLLDQIKEMRLSPNCTLDGITLLIERAHFKIRNIRVKISEVMKSRTERYRLQTKPN